MTAAALLTPLSIALVFAMAITAGLKVRIDEIVSSLGRTRLIVLGLVASFILVPLITVVLLHLFRAPPLVAAGFLIVSVCAGAPFSVPGTTVAKGDVPYAVDLMIVSAILSVVLAPLLLADVDVEVLREAEDEAEDVVGDHVAEDAAHVRDHDGRRDQFGEEVFLHAGGR